MKGISFIQGFPLPPIDLVLQALGATVCARSTGRSILCVKKAACIMSIKNFVRVDLVNNCIVVMRDDAYIFRDDVQKYEHEKNLGPLELISKVLDRNDDGSECYEEVEYSFEDAWHWIIKNISGYHCPLSGCFAIPIITAEFDHQKVKEDCREVYGSYQLPHLKDVDISI